MWFWFICFSEILWCSDWKWPSCPRYEQHGEGASMDQWRMHLAILGVLPFSVGTAFSVSVSDSQVLVRPNFWNSSSPKIRNFWKPGFCQQKKQKRWVWSFLCDGGKLKSACGLKSGNPIRSFTRSCQLFQQLYSISTSASLFLKPS